MRRRDERGCDAAKLVAAFILTLAAATAAPATRVRCLPIDDGPPVEAHELTTIQGGKADLQLPEGSRSLDLNELRRIEFFPATNASGDFVLKAWTRWDEVYVVQRLEQAEDGLLRLHGQGWTAGPMAFTDLVTIATAGFLDGATDLERERLREAGHPRRGEDQLMIRAAGRPHLLRGLVQDVGPDGVRAKFGDLERVLPWSRIDWILLGLETTTEPGGRPPYRLRLTDGTETWRRGVTLRDGAFADNAGRFSCERSSVAQIDISSDRYGYLSEWRPHEVEITPFLDERWEVRTDRCVTGAPIVLDGRTYEKGIGAGTKTELTYALRGEYAHLYATVGVDDTAGGRGRVIFRVLADGEEVFQSPVMTGRSPAIRVAVPIAGAQELTLVSDFGSDVRADGNFADWADARVVRGDE